MKYISVLLLVLIVTSAFAQPAHRGRKGGKPKYLKKLPLKLRIHPRPIAQDSFKVYLIVENVFDWLQFTRQGDQFAAEYQIEASFIQQKDKKLYSKSWTAQVTAENFAETNRRDKTHLSIDSLFLPAGQFEVKMLYRDLKGKQRLSILDTLKLKKTESIFASNPLFCVPAQLSEQTSNIFPAVPTSFEKAVPFNREFTIYNEFWAPGFSSLNVKCDIIDIKSENVLFTTIETIAVENNLAKLLFEPPFLEFSEGKYAVEVELNSQGIQKKIRTPFNIIWKNKPRSLHNFDYAKKALRLITDEAEFKILTKGKKQEQRRKFKSFWREKDPTTGTAYNEIFAEFYARVDSADKVWGHPRRGFGWDTEMGRIFVRNGKPDITKDYSLHPDDPKLIWVYEYSDRRLIFTFRSLNGRKEYMLIDEREELLNDS